MSSFRMRSAAAAALCLVTLAACSKTPTLSQDVPAIVNGAPITKVELNRAVKALMAQSGMAQPVAPEVMKQATEAAVDQLVMAELLYQAASKMEVKDLDRQVAERMAQSRSRYPSQEEFEKVLKSVEMTQKEAELAVRKDILINNMIEKQFAPKVSVSEVETKKFYDDNKAKAFRQGERVRVSQILVGVSEQAGPEARKEAKEKAQALLKRVRGGEDFAALANAASTPPTNKNGGDLGIVGKGDTVASFERVAFALKPGEVSELVESPLGYHIIKLSQRLPAATSGYEEVKVQIAAYLRQAKVRQAVTGYATQLRAKAKIEKV